MTNIVHFNNELTHNIKMFDIFCNVRLNKIK